MALFEATGAHGPAELTESTVLRWCGSARANNTVRSRLSQVNTFLRWCLRSGHLPDVLGSLPGPKIPAARRD